MAEKIRNTTGRPQNVLVKENQINQKINKELLPLLPSFVAEYNSFMNAQGRAVKTRLAYIQDISHFLDYMVQDTGLSEAKKAKDVSLADMENLRGRDVNEYLAYVQSYEAPDGTVITNGVDARARKRSSIAGLLRFLYQHDLISHDVTGKILTISSKDSKKAVKALEENEVMDLIDAVATGANLSDHQKRYWQKTRHRDKFILTLFVVAGLRVSELQQLNISSFNMKREEFVIYRKRGKESVIPMNKTLVDAYNEYMKMDRGHCTDVAKGHEDALFLGLSAKRKPKDGVVTSPGRKRLSINQIRALVHNYTSIAVGGEGVSPHKLRATAATIAIRRGNDISKVASLLDHDNIQTTKRYIKITEEDKRQVLSEMEL